MVLDNLLIIEKYTTQRVLTVFANSILPTVMKYCFGRWPDRNQWITAGMTVHIGLLLHGTRLVIPANMLNELLQKVHRGISRRYSAENSIGRQCADQY